MFLKNMELREATSVLPKFRADCWRLCRYNELNRHDGRTVYGAYTIASSKIKPLTLQKLLTHLHLVKYLSFSTNLAYNLKNNCIFQLPFSSRTPLTFSSTQDKVYLLGKHYDKDSRDQFYNAFEKIIWFSYRKL